MPKVLGEIAEQGIKFGVKQAGKAFKKLTPSALDNIRNIGREIEISPKSMYDIDLHLKSVPEDVGDVESIFKGMQAKDPDAFEAGNSFLHNLGAGNDAAAKMQAQDLANPARKATNVTPQPEPPPVHNLADLKSKQTLEQNELADWLDLNEQGLADGIVDLQKGFGPIIYNNKPHRISTSGVEKYFQADAGARDVKHLKVTPVRSDKGRSLQKDPAAIPVINEWLGMANQAWKSGTKVANKWGKQVRAGVNPEYLNPDMFRKSIVRASGYLAEINTKLRNLDPAFKDLQVEHAVSLRKGLGTDDVVAKHFGSDAQNVALNRAEVPKGSAFNQDSSEILGTPGPGQPEKAAEFTGKGVASTQRKAEYEQFGWLQAVTNRAIEAMETKGKGLPEALRVLKKERDALAKGELRGIKLRIPGTKVAMTDMLLIQQRALKTGNYAEAAESVIAEREILDLAIARGLLESEDAIKVLKKYIKFIDFKMDIDNSMRKIQKGKAEKWTAVQKPVDKYDVRKIPSEPAQAVNWNE